MKRGNYFAFALLATIFCGVLADDVASNETQAVEGTSFCGPAFCFCDTGLSPIEISCEGLDLHALFEEQDWNATFRALNLTGNEPLYVTFEDNNLVHIPRFPALNITYLSLKRNKISKIERSAFMNLENLQSLHLGNNKLTSESIYEAAFFGKFDNAGGGYFPLPLRHLNLSNNLIHTIPKDSFDHFVNLQSLDLSGNPLETLETGSKYAIGNLLNLESLTMGSAGLSKIPEGVLHSLSRLVFLDLSNNKFKEIPEELRQTHCLHVLTLDGNLFESFGENSFQNLTCLEDLSIQHCSNLRQINQYTFTPLKNLSKLTLAFNSHLEEIDDGAFENIIQKGEEDQWILKDVRLNDNGIRSFDHGLLPWEQLDYIDIRNNPYRCDCNLGWMVLELVNRIQGVTPTLARDMFCSEPENVKGRSLVDIGKEPELFDKCTSLPKSSPIFEGADIPSERIGTAAITVFVTGILLILIGLSILGFVFIKRRAIAQALISPSQIRYERAETEDASEWRYNSSRTPTPSVNVIPSQHYNYK